MALDNEFAAYTEKLRDRNWANEHEGKFVLIKGAEVIQFFDSYGDALRSGYEKFGLEPFLVKQVRSFEQARFISRLFDPCPTSPSR